MFIRQLFKNIGSMIKRHFIVLIFLILVTAFSSVIILFLYGADYNYREVKAVQEDDEEDYQDTMCIEATDSDSGYMTKAELLKCLDAIEAIQNELSEGISQYSVDCVIDDNTYGLNFVYKNGSICRADELAENLVKNGMIAEGEYWSDDDEKNGACVALIVDKTVRDTTPFFDSIMNGDKLVIGGKEYDIIGKTEWTSSALFPFSSVSDDAEIANVYILFDSYVSNVTYSKVTDIFNSYVGDKVESLEIHTVLRDMYTRKNIGVAAAIMMLTVIIGIAVLCRYISCARKEAVSDFEAGSITTMRLSGINICECVMLIIPAYALGALTYRYGIISRLSVYFPFIEECYSTGTYMLAFLICMSLSVAVAGVVLIIFNRKSNI